MGENNPGALPEALCAHLVHGLHAAAEPLTILLAGLSKENTDGMQVEELRNLTASSMSEVQRVCTLSRLLQQLLAPESAPAVNSMTLVPPLLLHVIDGVIQLFMQGGMPLHCVVQEPCPPLFLDRDPSCRHLSMCCWQQTPSREGTILYRLRYRVGSTNR